MKKDNYQKEIIKSIQKYQNKDGSFRVSIINNRINKGLSTSIFSTSMILSNLSTVSNIDNLTFLRKSANFLIKQHSVEYTWNYWNNTSKNFRVNPYPDDVDDSALALFSILQFGTIDKYMGKVKASLEQIEKQKHEKLGYNTWFVGKNANKHWFDFDPVVNSNVILLKNYLGMDVDKELVQNLYQGIEKDSLQSKYYSNKIHIIYFIVRMIPKYSNEKIVKRLVKALENKNDILTLSMILSSLIRLRGADKNIKKVYKKVVRMRTNWNEICPLHIESIEGNEINYAGSEALTLSFVLESFNLYRNYITEEFNLHTINEKLINISLAKIKPETRVVKLLSEPLKYIMSWKSVRRIILLPHEISNIKDGTSRKIIDKLCTIGLLGWTAFTIDDHIRDGDNEIKASWVSVSISNIFKNRMYQLINEVSKKESSFRIYEMIERMEIYSALEDINNDLNYRKMEHTIKSIGLSLPVFILFNLRNKSIRHKNLLFEFFKYYISARQISDDATDWKEDLKSGRRTYVTKLISDKQDTTAFEKEFFPKVTRKIAADCRKSINYSAKIFGTKINPLANLNYEYIKATRREMLQKLLS